MPRMPGHSSKSPQLLPPLRATDDLISSHDYVDREVMRVYGHPIHQLRSVGQRNEQGWVPPLCHGTLQEQAMGIGRFYSR